MNAFFTNSPMFPSHLQFTLCPPVPPTCLGNIRSSRYGWNTGCYHPDWTNEMCNRTENNWTYGLQKPAHQDNNSPIIAFPFREILLMLNKKN